jgi:hypothetical protein
VNQHSMTAQIRSFDEWEFSSSSRSRTIRRSVRFVVFAILFIVSASSTFGDERRPANIVVFLADDLGRSDLGCYGSTFYETPHLDQLARDGVRFTDAYAACPVCSPTRASLMTGQWPQRTGITDYIGAPLTPEGWKRNTELLPAPYSDRLSLDSPTLAKSLKMAGYATFFAGKWHLGPEGWWPENQGFDINRGGIDRGGPYGGKKYFSPYGNPRLEDGPPGEHLPDRLATETTRFIEQNRDRPFFAYFSFYSVHTPLMAREDLRLKYEEKRKRLGLEARWGREEPRDVRLVQEHAVYAGMVDAMDQAVGKVLAKLDELQLRENTLVVFTSDNGGTLDQRGLADVEPAVTSRQGLDVRGRNSRTFSGPLARLSQEGGQGRAGQRLLHADQQSRSVSHATGSGQREARIESYVGRGEPRTALARRVARGALALLALSALWESRRRTRCGDSPRRLEADPLVRRGPAGIVPAGDRPWRTAKCRRSRTSTCGRIASGTGRVANESGRQTRHPQPRVRPQENQRPLREPATVATTERCEATEGH